MTASTADQLDVERLARALHQAYCQERRPMHSDQFHSAEAIARLYGLMKPKLVESPRFGISRRVR